jgi:hypothetical protein
MSTTGTKIITPFYSVKNLCINLSESSLIINNEKSSKSVTVVLQIDSIILTKNTVVLIRHIIGTVDKKKLEWIYIHKIDEYKKYLDLDTVSIPTAFCTVLPVRELSNFIINCYLRMLCWLTSK